MGFIIDLHQVVNAHMGVSLGCRQACMAEQFLYHPKIGAGIKHVCGKSVSQPMGANWAQKAQLSNDLLQQPSNGASR
jgi:hypothetical protein